MIYLENTQETQYIMLPKSATEATQNPNKGVTVKEAEEIAKNAVDTQQFKTINGEDIRGEGNIEIKGGGTDGVAYYEIYFHSRADLPTTVGEEITITDEEEVPEVIFHGEPVNSNYYAYGTVRFIDAVFFANGYGAAKKRQDIECTFCGEQGSYGCRLQRDESTGKVTSVTITFLRAFIQPNIGNPTTPVYFDGLGNAVACPHSSSGRYYSFLPYVNVNGRMDVCMDIDFHANKNDTKDYDVRLHTSADGRLQTKTTGDTSYRNLLRTTLNVRNMFDMTQAEYDALEIKDDYTIYIVEGRNLYWRGKQIGGGGVGVTSVNGKIGDVKIKSINGTDLVNEGTEQTDIKIVQPLWNEAAVKCGIEFDFKLDESGNEVIESVVPYGYMDINGGLKHRFFQNFYSTESQQLADIGLYRAYFKRPQDGIGDYSSQSTYGTINTWGNTLIKNTEEDPDAEVVHYSYYVSFTVISPYTFTKYDVTVLSYYVSADVEDANTWKIIWKKAN